MVKIFSQFVSESVLWGLIEKQENKYQSCCKLLLKTACIYYALLPCSLVPEAWLVFSSPLLIHCLPYPLPGSLPRGGWRGLTTSSLPCSLASRWVWLTGVTGQDQRARRDTDVYLPWPLPLRVLVVAAFYGSPSSRLIILFLVEVPLVSWKDLTDTIVTCSQLKKICESKKWFLCASISCPSVYVTEQSLY